jgi:hypothetical protein
MAGCSNGGVDCGDARPVPARGQTLHPTGAGSIVNMMGATC